MIYRHKTRGTVYEVLLTDVTIEATMEPSVVYRCIEDGKMWVRPAREFYDGRFEEVHFEPQAKAETAR